MGVTTFQLRTRRDQKRLAPPAILLDWLGDREASTVQARQSLSWHLAVPAVADDLLKFAAGVYLADRLTVRPGTWTRAIDLVVPVRDVEVWKGALDGLAKAVNFLSGDRWRFGFMSSNAAPPSPPELAPPVDAVCLFSGGLDSFTGALDLLAEGKRVCLVGHYEAGQAPQTQAELFRELARRFPGKLLLRQIFLRPAAPHARQARPLPPEREASQRSRSLLFLAAGLTVAAGYGPRVPLYIPENGFIGINVPLTPSRSGSFSTRTTHPYFMATFAQSVQRLGITNPIVNPFRTMTKGEILAACQDQQTLRALAPRTLSCAHPEASRYAQRRQGNCGYCFPCLIRRASMHHVGLDRARDYAFDALREDGEMALERGDDLRALIRSLNRPYRPLDVLRNGPVASEEVAAFAGVYGRGRGEILAWMTAAARSRNVRRQLPRS
jgi:7-cyano-7-deazaguanine synthase in queuosine biosynthesis